MLAGGRHRNGPAMRGADAAGGVLKGTGVDSGMNAAAPAFSVMLEATVVLPPAQKCVLSAMVVLFSRMIELVADRLMLLFLD